MGDGVSLPIPHQFGCDECILTHITLYLNQKRGKSRAKLVGSSWYVTPLLWDTPHTPGFLMRMETPQLCKALRFKKCHPLKFPPEMGARHIGYMHPLVKDVTNSSAGELLELRAYVALMQ